jgi:hypothetical protein
LAAPVDPLPEPLVTELMRERAQLRLGKERAHMLAGRAAEGNVPQQVIAAQLGLPEPTVSNMIRRYRTNPEAFARAPMDAVLERAAGDIEQATMLEQLMAWPYTATVIHDLHMGELSEHMTVSDLSDLTLALIDGLLSEEEFHHVASRVKPR